MAIDVEAWDIVQCFLEHACERDRELAVSRQRVDPTTALWRVTPEYYMYDGVTCTSPLASSARVRGQTPLHIALVRYSLSEDKANLRCCVNACRALIDCGAPLLCRRDCHRGLGVVHMIVDLAIPELLLQIIEKDDAMMWESWLWLRTANRKESLLSMAEGKKTYIIENACTGMQYYCSLCNLFIVAFIAKNALCICQCVTMLSTLSEFLIEVGSDADSESRQEVVEECRQCMLWATPLELPRIRCTRCREQCVADIMTGRSAAELCCEHVLTPNRSVSLADAFKAQEADPNWTSTSSSECRVIRQQKLVKYVKRMQDKVLTANDTVEFLNDDLTEEKNETLKEGVLELLRIGPRAVEVRELLEPLHPCVRYCAGASRQFGLFATRPVERGEWIIEFVGELKPEGMAISQLDCVSKLSAQDRFHRLRALDNSVENIIIDASHYSNEAVFMNDPRDWATEVTTSHAADLSCNAVFVETVVNEWPHMLVFCTKAIGVGAEVLANYGDSYWEGVEKRKERMKWAVKYCESMSGAGPAVGQREEGAASNVQLDYSGFRERSDREHRDRDRQADIIRRGAKQRSVGDTLSLLG